MKHQLQKILCTIVCLTVLSVQAQSAISYTLFGGRFGDNLITYIKAKWLARNYGMQFLYQPFPFSDQLVLHVKEQQYSDSVAARYKQRIDISYKGSESYTRFNQAANVLYRINVLFEVNDWPDINQISARPFIDELRLLIAPRNPLQPLQVPQGMLSVAVHVRTGGDYEKPVFDEHGAFMGYLPLRFPPHDYYIEQIATLARMFPDRQLYIFIFTDDSHPERIAARYKEALHNPNLTFGYREHGNRHDAHVLEDFFAIAGCDLLIRPESGFSQVAQLIGHHKVVIAPAACTFEGDKLIITQVKIVQKEQ